ncbi:MAG: SCO family protein [Aquabacterium sp.]
MLALSLAAAGCGREPGAPKFKGIDITGADYARTLTLLDPDGQTRSLAEFKGKVVAVFFGYTQCPDVCPTTMAELSQVRKSLGADGERIVGIFVTVDPERDQPALLKEYVGNFGPGFVALHGSMEQTQAAAREFKVFFAKGPVRAGQYTVDHTAGIYLFDAQGRVRVFTRHGSGVQALADDLKALLALPS